MSDLDELLEAFQRVCIDAEPSATDLARLEREGGGPSGRFGLYRELVRSRLRDLVASAFPRTTRAIGREAMDRLAEAHLSSGAPTTRFFREHAEAFAAWAEVELARAPIGPAWSRDLSRLEAAQWQANYRMGAPATRVTAFALDRVPIPSPTLRLFTLDWDVHVSGDAAPSPGHFHLAVYRRPDHKVETRWMAPIWAALIGDFARSAQPAIGSVRDVLSAHGRVADEAFVDEMTSFVAQLVDNGALLGSVPSET